MLVEFQNFLYMKRVQSIEKISLSMLYRAPRRNFMSCYRSCLQYMYLFTHGLISKDYISLQILNDLMHQNIVGISIAL